jgi:hypothetical protein
MANFGALTLTRAGRNVLAKAQTGAPLQFVRVAVGDGELPADIIVENMQGLINPVKDLPINGNTVIGDGTTKIDAVLSNHNQLFGFDLREIGLFARNSAEEDAVLYAYANAGDLPTFIPAGNGPNQVNIIIGLTTVIKQAQNIIVNIDENWGFVTEEQLENRFLNLYGEYISPATHIWSSDGISPQLRPMPVSELASELLGGIGGDESVLYGWDPVSREAFGFPLSLLVARTPRITGGNLAIAVNDYEDEISGGDLTIPLNDYDGEISGGDMTNL